MANNQNKDLIYAILSMDSYNRGYDFQIKNLSEIGTVGDWSILTTSQVQFGQVAEDIGFYAIAYKNIATGETVISYRGSDDKTKDVIFGYGTAAGFAYEVQAAYSIAFYRAVAEAQGYATNLTGANITLTGHSLGAGLAGQVAGIYNRPGFFADPMPFGTAVNTAYKQMTPRDPDFNIDFYNAVHGSSVTEWNRAQASYFKGVAIPTVVDDWNTNWLDFYRRVNNANIGAPMAYLDLPADTPLDWTLTNSVGQRHAIGLIILRMFADTLPDGDWEHAAKYWMPALFDDDLAKAAGAESFTGPNGDHASTLQYALAYSAIDEGDRPFGDTAIHALFNDAGDLGRALKGTDVPAIIRDNAAAIAQMLVQYAGKLALGDVEAKVNDTDPNDDADVRSGILKVSDGGGLLSIDMSDARWSHDIAHSEILGREALVAGVLALLPRFSGITVTAAEVERVILATGNIGGTIDVNGSLADKTTITVGGGGADHVRGTTARDIMIGGDVLDAGAGNDVVYATGTKATTIGGLGRDWIYNTSKGGVIWGDVENSFRRADGTRGYDNDNSYSVFDLQPCCA